MAFLGLEFKILSWDEFVASLKALASKGDSTPQLQAEVKWLIDQLPTCKRADGRRLAQRELCVSFDYD